MSTNLLHPLNIITKLSIKVLSKDLRVLSSLEILLSVEEPEWDLELTRILNNGDNLFDFVGGELSGALVDVDFGLFANEVGETASETLDFGKSEYDVTLSLHVGVENTEDVLKLGSLN
jgi:hypothetical protein